MGVSPCRSNLPSCPSARNVTSLSTRLKRSWLEVTSGTRPASNVPCVINCWTVQVVPNTRGNFTARFATVVGLVHGAMDSVVGHQDLRWTRERSLETQSLSQMVILPPITLVFLPQKARVVHAAAAMFITLTRFSPRTRCGTSNASNAEHA